MDFPIKFDEKSPVLFNFDNLPVRIIEKDGKPEFVAKDIADILGYSDTQAMTRRLDDDELSTCTDRLSGQVREMITINESGLFNAILGSQKAEAKVFRKWVTSEVLPSLRRYGGYIYDSAWFMREIEKAANDPNFAHGIESRKGHMLRVAAGLETYKSKIEEENRQLKARIRLLEDYAKENVNRMSLAGVSPREWD
jgi:prophage antirepressor-like protein